MVKVFHYLGRAWAIDSSGGLWYWTVCGGSPRTPQIPGSLWGDFPTPGFRHLRSVAKGEIYDSLPPLPAWDAALLLLEHAASGGPAIV